MVLSVAGGGPSLADTWQDLRGVVAAVNGSCGFLIERGHIPHLCGVLDASPHMADVIAAHPEVRYYVASICDNRVFDKLAGCETVLWHPTGYKGIEEWIPRHSLIVGGGCTMGLRWLTLGYVLGFRKFELHGLDSSYRDDQTHAYKDHGDRNDPVMMVHGRRTQLNFTEQVSDFFDWMERFKHSPELDDVTIKVHGDGLLQDEWKRRGYDG